MLPDNWKELPLRESRNGQVSSPSSGRLRAKRSIFLSHFAGLSTFGMTVDPTTLRATAIERITTGPGPDAQLALSSDGRKLAFTAEVQHIQAWLFPFDASRGKLTGAGRAVTPVGLTTWRQSLSADGTRLTFSCGHGGRSELWEMSLVNSHIAPVVAHDQLRDRPLWSPDGKHLAYFRTILWRMMLVLSCGPRRPETKSRYPTPPKRLACMTGRLMARSS